jgi:hypothetical protein
MLPFPNTHYLRDGANHPRLAKSRYDCGAIAAILRRRGLLSVAAHPPSASLFGFLFDVMLQQQQ